MCAVHGNTRVLTGIGFLPPRSPSQPHKIFPSNAPPRRGPQFPNPRPCRHRCRFTRFRCWFNGGIGLAPSTKTLNWVVKIVTEMGLVEYAENLFGEMCARGVQSNCVSYRSWLLVIVKWVMFWRRIGGWYFRRFCEMGLGPNLINFTCMIEGLCKRGSMKQAFEMLEEMVGRGWKPNVYTHTALIDGLCKKRWTDKAFRLFLMLVRSENHKPNVLMYTAMISGYCRDEKMNRAEMLLSRMKEQGLVPNTNTYTTLVDGHCKAGNFERVYELMNEEGSSPNVEIKQALVLFNKMVKSGIQPDFHSYTTLIAVFCREKRMKESNLSFAFKFFHRMSDHGCAPDSITYGALISGLCKQSKLDEAGRLHDAMIEKGLTPCEVTQVTLAYEYCKIDDGCPAMVVLERLEKKPWVWTVNINTLVRKLCSERKVGMAAPFFHKLLDMDPNVNHVTIAAFMIGCYESYKYALISDLSARIYKENH
ncbi:Pentatricopeptide repeat-containing protein [Glycine soja]|nr:Pentatricopeptide repeat-containing protein [Glycine soja]